MLLQEVEAARKPHSISAAQQRREQLDLFRLLGGSLEPTWPGSELMHLSVAVPDPLVSPPCISASYLCLIPKSGCRIAAVFSGELPIGRLCLNAGELLGALEPYMEHSDCRAIRAAAYECISRLSRPETRDSYKDIRVTEMLKVLTSLALLTRQTESKLILPC